MEIRRTTFRLQSEATTGQNATGPTKKQDETTSTKASESGGVIDITEGKQNAPPGEQKTESLLPAQTTDSKRDPNAVETLATTGDCDQFAASATEELADAASALKSAIDDGKEASKKAHGRERDESIAAARLRVGHAADRLQRARGGVEDTEHTLRSRMARTTEPETLAKLDAGAAALSAKKDAILQPFVRETAPPLTPLIDSKIEKKCDDYIKAWYGVGNSEKPPPPASWLNGEMPSAYAKKMPDPSFSTKTGYEAAAAKLWSEYVDGFLTNVLSNAAKAASEEAHDIAEQQKGGPDLAPEKPRAHGAEPTSDEPASKLKPHLP